MKKANNSFDEIMEWVLSAETIALAGHTNPDGDAIGACLALGGALEKAGKQVQVILEKYADKYQLIPNGHLVCAAEDADRKSTRLNSSHNSPSRMPSSA